MSWLGRVNAVKMTLLPRILYLFRSLPIPITKRLLDKLQSAIICFIWDSKGHRLPKTVLFRSRKRGGLELSNLWWYYQTAQLCQFSVIYSKGLKPDWVDIERQATPNHTLDFLVWSPQKNRPPILSPTLSHSMTLCDSLHKRNSLTSAWHPFSHIVPPGSQHQGL